MSVGIRPPKHHYTTGQILICTQSNGECIVSRVDESGWFVPVLNWRDLQREARKAVQKVGAGEVRVCPADIARRATWRKGGR